MKKLLLSFFLFAIGYSLIATFPSPALAQGDQGINAVPARAKSWQVKSQPEWENIVRECDNPISPILNSECYSGPYSLGSLLHTLLALFQGPTNNPHAGLQGIFPNLYATTLFSQPSSLDYLAYIGKNFGFNIVRPAYAQGGGFTNFQPLIPIWSIFRNLAYIVFILIFLVIGFMIMFRHKIDPQTVVGIQHALPRIVVALLLVTFSYAIVGFMIDLMVLLVSTIAIYLGNEFSSFTGNPTALIAIAQKSVFELVDPIGEIAIPIGYSIDFAIGKIFTDIPLIPWLSGLTVKLIFSAALVFAMFKIFFMLLENYIQIILSVIFGPLQLTLAAIPGNKTISSWLTGLLSHILVFPVTFALIFIASLFATQKSSNLSSPFSIDPNIAWERDELSWAPPLMGGALQQQQAQPDPNNPDPRLITGQNLVGPLIAFGIILVIPKVGEIIKAQFQVKELPAGESIREQLGRGAGWIPGFGGLAQKALTS